MLYLCHAVNFKVEMNQKYSIELIEEHDEVSFYSVFIASRIRDGEVIIRDKKMIGNLNFTRYEKK